MGEGAQHLRAGGSRQGRRDLVKLNIGGLMRAQILDMARRAHEPRIPENPDVKNMDGYSK